MSRHSRIVHVIHEVFVRKCGVCVQNVPSTCMYTYCSTWVVWEPTGLTFMCDAFMCGNPKWDLCYRSIKASICLWRCSSSWPRASPFYMKIHMEWKSWMDLCGSSVLIVTLPVCHDWSHNHICCVGFVFTRIGIRTLVLTGTSPLFVHRVYRDLCHSNHLMGPTEQDTELANPCHWLLQHRL